MRRNKRNGGNGSKTTARDYDNCDYITRTFRLSSVDVGVISKSSKDEHYPTESSA